MAAPMVDVSSLGKCLACVVEDGSVAPGANVDGIEYGKLAADIIQLVDGDEGIVLTHQSTERDGRMLFLAPDADKALHLVKRYKFQVFGGACFTFIHAEAASAAPAKPPSLQKQRSTSFPKGAHVPGALAARLASPASDAHVDEAPIVTRQRSNSFPIERSSAEEAAAEAATKRLSSGHGPGSRGRSNASAEAFGAAAGTMATGRGGAATWRASSRGSSLQGLLDATQNDVQDCMAYMLRERESLIRECFLDYGVLRRRVVARYPTLPRDVAQALNALEFNISDVNMLLTAALATHVLLTLADLEQFIMTTNKNFQAVTSFDDLKLGPLHMHPAWQRVCPKSTADSSLKGEEVVRYLADKISNAPSAKDPFSPTVALDALAVERGFVDHKQLGVYLRHDGPITFAVGRAKRGAARTEKMIERQLASESNKGQKKNGPRPEDDSSDDQLAGPTDRPPPPLCAVDGAYTFTGAATSYLTATSRNGIVGEGLGFTLCAWVYRTRTGSWDRVIDFGNGPGADNVLLGFPARGSIMGYHVYHGDAFSEIYASPPSFPANVWTHVAVVQSRASLTDTYGPAQIYWNGASVATTSSMRFPLPVSRSNLYVGKSHWARDSMFTGQMKDLLVWDVALSPAQLDGVRLGGGLPSTPAPLISMMRSQLAPADTAAVAAATPAAAAAATAALAAATTAAAAAATAAVAAATPPVSADEDAEAMPANGDAVLRALQSLLEDLAYVESPSARLAAAEKRLLADFGVEDFDELRLAEPTLAAFCSRYCADVDPLLFAAASAVSGGPSTSATEFASAMLTRLPGVRDDVLEYAMRTHFGVDSMSVLGWRSVSDLRLWLKQHSAVAPDGLPCALVIAATDSKLDVSSSVHASREDALARFDALPPLTDVALGMQWQTVHLARLGSLASFLVREKLPIIEVSHGSFVKLEVGDIKHFEGALKRQQATRAVALATHLCIKAGGIELAPIELMRGCMAAAAKDLPSKDGASARLVVQCAAALRAVWPLRPALKKVFSDGLERVLPEAWRQMACVASEEELAALRVVAQELGRTRDLESALKLALKGAPLSTEEVVPPAEVVATEEEKPVEKPSTAVMVAEPVAAVVEPAAVVVAPEVVAEVVPSSTADGTERSCRELCAYIRKRFGIGLDTDESRLDADIRSAFQELRGVSQRSTNRLAEELYAGSEHFVLELIQNADDNEYAEGATPALHITVAPNRVRFDNNELGFTEMNVLALCNIGKSTKARSDPSKIGNKGIGWKSSSRSRQRRRCTRAATICASTRMTLVGWATSAQSPLHHLLGGTRAAAQPSFCPLQAPVRTPRFATLSLRWGGCNQCCSCSYRSSKRFISSSAAA
jgi:hypothetical protein